MIATKRDLAVLASLLEAGGSGEVDVHGRVCVGPTRIPLIADTTTWLRLVASGLVSGENDKIIATETARETAGRLVSGYVAGEVEKTA